MSLRCPQSILAVIGLLLPITSSHAQVSKANQILINRGLQIQGMVATYDSFSLSRYSNANYTAVIWLWDPPRSYNNMSVLGSAPGFPWARWVFDENDMPALGGEAAYLSQCVNLQLADEWHLNDDATRTRAVNWFNAVRNNWPNTILSANNWGGQVTDGNMIDFCTRAQPDMICFDTYPWQSVWDINAPNHTGPPISGPPTQWYGHLRIYRDISRAFNIPYGAYVQTFHAVQDYNNTVYRDPSPSELRLNHFGALAFDAKMLIDFVYNNGSSSLFTPPGGDSNPNALFYEKADCALRSRNFGKALVRLKPIAEATAQWTTSITFVRGRDANGTLNPIPINFYAGPGGTNPNTDWVTNRNDPWLRDWVVTNTGTKNNSQPGDVIISWFKPLDESFDGPGFTNEIYFMVVNGLTATNGTAADCSQEIKLNFADTFTSLDMLNPASGQLTNVPLPIVSTRRQLTLNLNGGDAALFKIATGAPFVGFPFSTNAPAISSQPQNRTNLIGTDASFGVVATGNAPLKYQWRFNGLNISGATTNSYTRTNVQSADAGNYTVVVTNSSGSITSAVATLTVTTNLLYLYEPFDYPNIGSPVSDNTPANWAFGGSGANDLSVVVGSLAHPGLWPSTGNSVTNGGAGLAVRRLFGANVNSGQLYFSALFRINNLGFGAWSGASSQVGAFADTNASSNFRLAVMVKSNSPSGYVIGVQKGGTGVSPVFGASEFRAGETVLLVGKYDFEISPNTVTLWVNPPLLSLGSNPAPATGFLSTNSGLDGFTIDRFNMRQNTATGGSSVPAAMQWDELRVGPTWASVTPRRYIRFDSVAKISANQILLRGSSDVGIVSIEGSSNFLSWSALTNFPNTNGVFEVTQPFGNFGQRYYRAILSP